MRSLIVVDALAEVIEWHEQGLLPLGKQLTGDPRCRLVNGDFFAMSGSAEGFDPDSAAAAASMPCWWISITPRPTCCIRATPRCTGRRGLLRLAAHLHPGGVFALWSNDPPDPAFERCAHRAPLQPPRRMSSPSTTSDGDHDASNTVYVGVKA